MVILTRFTLPPYPSPCINLEPYAAKKKARERSRLRYQGQRLLSDAILKRNGHAPMHWQATSTPPSSSDRSVSSSNSFVRRWLRQPCRSVTQSASRHVIASEKSKTRLPSSRRENAVSQSTSFPGLSGQRLVIYSLQSSRSQQLHK